MFIIWRRWGPLGLLFLVLGFLLWVGLGAVIKSTLQITATTGWWSVIALVLGFGAGALANWVFAVRVVEPRLDRPQGANVAPSTLFFLPLRHWTWAIVAIGLLFLVPNVIAAVAG
jgi:hypothetical protein